MSCPIVHFHRDRYLAKQRGGSRTGRRRQKKGVPDGGRCVEKRRTLDVTSQVVPRGKSQHTARVWEPNRALVPHALERYFTPCIAMPSG